MKNNMVITPHKMYIIFSIIKNILFSISIFLVIQISSSFINKYHYKIALFLWLILFPLDIIYDYILLKNYIIVVGMENLELHEGIFIKKTIIIPKKRVYSISNIELPFFKKYWYNLELKTLVKDFKLCGVSITDNEKVKKWWEYEALE
ncbi:hypothetical protein CIRMBP1197_00149 [Enterococcus cecorum]|uniref:hypothetical protein n=1 Tax=Enterococcus cecorum TaxID=44008 RepID=UPI0022D986F2|nr:hypothetical protein CIRMBP1197_00149 [Enterococcus cecorum]CAI3330446.1 hypothetical protein CIRMBP1320_00250 [Enterococcus cecorum]